MGGVMPNTLDIARQQKTIAEMRQAGQDTTQAEAQLGGMFAILRACKGYPVDRDQSKNQQTRPTG